MTLRKGLCYYETPAKDLTSDFIPTFIKFNWILLLKIRLHDHHFSNKFVLCSSYLHNVLGEAKKVPG